MVIITLLTQVRKEKNGKINFRPGIEPGTQRLGSSTLDTRPLPRTKVYLPIIHKFISPKSPCAFV